MRSSDGSFSLLLQIKEYEKLDSEDERLARSRQIYDTYIMKELLSCSHVRSVRAAPRRAPSGSRTAAGTRSRCCFRLKSVGLCLAECSMLFFFPPSLPVVRCRGWWCVPSFVKLGGMERKYLEICLFYISSDLYFEISVCVP